jgi:TonB-linked SusC/RagA family outer membrane protein
LTAALLATPLTLPVALPAQQVQSGIISGRVTDRSTQAPVAEARISILGTTLQTVTNPNGEYRLANVSPGRVQVSVIRIGYRASSDTVVVTAGATASLNFSLQQSVTALSQVVVTGTAGNQERRAQPAQVASVAAEDIKRNAVVVNVNEMLQSRVPGISVGTNSGTAGTASSIRIRGASSLSLSNQPIVFIDGVRMIEGQSNLGLNGQVLDRMNDINPDDIASIEVVKGPAAATLYGADASTGVIQIITKRGLIGARSFQQSMRVEGGTVKQTWTPPANYGICTAALIVPTSPSALCRGQPAGTLVQDNPMLRTNALRNGSDLLLGYTGRGGGQDFGYYLSAGSDRNIGTLPANEFQRQSVRGNINFIPDRRITVDVGVQSIRSKTRLPDNDNSLYGILTGAMLGSPLTVRDDTVPSNNGWFAFNRSVEALTAIENTLETQRNIITGTATYLPFSWFKNRVTLGADLANDEATRFFPTNAVGWFDGSLNGGQNRQARVGVRRYTIDYLADFDRNFHDGALRTTASVGAQVIATRFDSVGALGLGFASNASHVISSAASTSGGQTVIDTRQIGYLSQLQIGWHDRRFLQLGARMDDFSAFGANTKAIFLPKVGVSWVVSDEGFFEPLSRVVSSLRLRAAYGTTGRAPAAGAALQTLRAAPSVVSTSLSAVTVVPGATLLNPGNTELKPERGIEVESGADVSMFGDRLALELTYFNKTSKDVLLLRTIAPSVGFAQNPYANIGEINNRGWEVAVDGQILRTARLGWTSRVSFNTLHNELVSLGGLAPFSTSNGSNRFVEGFQTGAWVSKRIRNINEETGVVTVSDTLESAGNVLPTFEGSWSNTFTLFKRLRMVAMFDTKQDYLVQNYTQFYRETQIPVSANRVDPNKLSRRERLRRYGNPTPGQPAFRQENGGATTVNEVRDAFLQPGDFVRFRELSFSYDLPPGIASRIGPVSTASLGLAFQNLKLWSDFEGADPEVNGYSDLTGTAGFGRSDFFTLPTARRALLRLNITF